MRPSRTAGSSTETQACPSYCALPALTGAARPSHRCSSRARTFSSLTPTTMASSHWRTFRWRWRSTTRPGRGQSGGISSAQCTAPSTATATASYASRSLPSCACAKRVAAAPRRARSRRRRCPRHAAGRREWEERRPVRPCRPCHTPALEAPRNGLALTPCLVALPPLHAPTRPQGCRHRIWR